MKSIIFILASLTLNTALANEACVGLDGQHQINYTGALFTRKLAVVTIKDGGENIIASTFEGYDRTFTMNTKLNTVTLLGGDWPLSYSCLMSPVGCTQIIEHFLSKTSYIVSKIIGSKEQDQKVLSCINSVAAEIAKNSAEIYYQQKRNQIDVNIK